MLVVSGSNDKSFRTWSLGEFSLDDELEPPCTPLEHFALGDLEARVSIVIGYCYILFVQVRAPAPAPGIGHYAETGLWQKLLLFFSIFIWVLIFCIFMFLSKIKYALSIVK